MEHHAACLPGARRAAGSAHTHLYTAVSSPSDARLVAGACTVTSPADARLVAGACPLTFETCPRDFQTSRAPEHGKHYQLQSPWMRQPAAAAAAAEAHAMCPAVKPSIAQLAWRCHMGDNFPAWGPSLQQRVPTSRSLTHRYMQMAFAITCYWTLSTCWLTPSAGRQAMCVCMGRRPAWRGEQASQSSVSPSLSWPVSAATRHGWTGGGLRLNRCVVRRHWPAVLRLWSTLVYL